MPGSLGCSSSSKWGVRDLERHERGRTGKDQHGKPPGHRKNQAELFAKAPALFFRELRVDDEDEAPPAAGGGEAAVDVVLGVDGAEGVQVVL